MWLAPLPAGVVLERQSPAVGKALGERVVHVELDVLHVLDVLDVLDGESVVGGVGAALVEFVEVLVSRGLVCRGLVRVTGLDRRQGPTRRLRPVVLGGARPDPAGRARPRDG